jgi:hypothetical protein
MRAQAAQRNYELRVVYQRQLSVIAFPRLGISSWRTSCLLGLIIVFICAYLPLRTGVAAADIKASGRVGRVLTLRRSFLTRARRDLP